MQYKMILSLYLNTKHVLDQHKRQLHNDSLFFFFYTVLTVKYFFLNLPKQKCCCNMVTFKFSHWTLTSTVFHIPIVTLLKKNLLIVIIFVFIHKLLYSAPRISYFSCWVHKCLLLRMYCLPCWCSLEIRA